MHISAPYALKNLSLVFGAELFISLEKDIASRISIISKKQLTNDEVRNLLGPKKYLHIKKGHRNSEIQKTLQNHNINIVDL